MLSTAAVQPTGTGDLYIRLNGLLARQDEPSIICGWQHVKRLMHHVADPKATQVRGHSLRQASGSIGCQLRSP